MSRDKDEARETLEAIASGAVDAVVVNGPNGPQIFRLESPDQPFRTLVEKIQEGAMTLDANGKILFANTFLGTLVGVEASALIGRNFSSLVPSHDMSTVASLIREGVESTVKGQCRLEAGDGESIPVQLTLSPLVSVPAPTCCGVVFDLREREQAEAAHAARLAAEEATRAKDQFLAVLSHELRSPLNVILGWSQILADDASLGEATLRAVRTIERSAQAQAGLIADLLDISRIVAGKLNLEMQELDLPSLVEACVVAARPTVLAKGIELRHALVDDAHIHGDATRIQQIVTNLINNAVKFTPSGGSIDVTMTTVDELVTIEVADTGMGIEPDQLERVFELFQQGRQAAQQKSGGLGLGLAISKQLAEVHGGTLSVRSDGEGRGATFTVRLPRLRKSSRPRAEPFQPAGEELRGVRALVIDDEKDNLALSRYILEKAGCTVECAACAEEALALLTPRKFGLIVSDIGLPDQDGFELMREIRARGFSAEDLPAVAVTGYAGSHDARLADAVGFQRHLAKPIDPAVLVRVAAELSTKQR